MFLNHLKNNNNLTQDQIGNVKHIYLLSERGYMKLVGKVFEDEKKLR